ncbi:SPW repeat protein [Actinoplanes sp. NPDC026619]|uniref:SPW repeat protein n=1 Tax=Actinoplanes sp. NPDC026619 TaxID=3155798 RepID=UPI0033E816EF
MTMRPENGMIRRLTTDLVYTPSVFVAVAGVWIAATPLVVDNPGRYPAWNDIATGLSLTAVGALRVLAPRRTAVLGLVSVLLGGWLVAAPFVLDYAVLLGVAWNDIVIGVLVVMFAGVGALAGAARRSPPRTGRGRTEGSSRGDSTTTDPEPRN